MIGGCVLNSSGMQRQVINNIVIRPDKNAEGVRRLGMYLMAYFTGYRILLDSACRIPDI
jgi:hypothetical protein